MTRHIIAVGLLAACSPAPKAADAPPAAPTPPTANGSASPVAAAFLCADSTQVFALFRSDSAGKSEVALAINEDRLHLPQLVSASGARYGDSSTTFWNKGDSATFTWRGNTTSCHVVK